MLYIKNIKKHTIINLPTRIQLFFLIKIKIKNRNLVSRNHNFFSSIQKFKKVKSLIYLLEYNFFFLIKIKIKNRNLVSRNHNFF
jgi:hypothetical protein